jgi:hypothetical protein
MTKKFILITAVFLFISNISSAQFFNKFSLFGGPMVGWQVPNVNDLNAEIKKLGISEFSSSGYLTLGGGGYIDVPVVSGLRIGAFGTGFTEDKVAPNQSANIPLFTAKFSFRYTAISIEYARKLSKNFDYTLGGNIGVGTTKLQLTQFDPVTIIWNTNNGSSLLTYSQTSSYTTTTYTFNPQVGLGYNVTKFMYLKLNAGYMFTLRGDWKLNDVLTVTNVPSGIKADGFNFNLGINFGLFTD